MKKDRRRLVLNGSDDTYARREAAKNAGGAAEDEAGLRREPGRTAELLKPDPASRPERESRAVDEKSGEQPPVGAAPPDQMPFQTFQVNYRLNLGHELSEWLQRLAEAHDQPLELIMKGLRARAADRFRDLASATTKPPIPEPEAGGKSIRYATSLSGDMAQNLNAWFDPFDLGVAKDACKPILIGLFQEEAKALCESAQRKHTERR